MNPYYIEITFLTIYALVMMIFVVSKNSLLSGHQKRSLMSLYLLLIMAICFEWLGVFLNGKPKRTMLVHGLVKAMEYSLVPYLCIQFLDVIKLKKKNWWLLGLVGVNALIAFLSLVTRWIFYIDENNVYQYGHYKWVYTALCIFCGLYTQIKCFNYGNHFQSSDKRISTALLMLPITGIVLRQVNRGVRLEMLCITLAGIFMYIYYVDILQNSDALTGLLNRGSYICKISKLSGKAGVLYFDVDEFKNINDKYGHISGDKALTIVGKTIKEVYAAAGSCYRIGGDEFCVILEEKMEKIDSLNALFERRLDQIRKTETNLPTVSLGYSLFDSKKDKIEDVITRADKNMYRMKTKLQRELRETNRKLLATVQAFQLAAEESSTLVFVYDLEKQSILVDEKTAKAFGVKERQEGVPYRTAKMGVVSEDTVDEYIRIHEEMLQGTLRAAGIVKLIQADGTQSIQSLTFRAVLDDDGNPTGSAVGIYSAIEEKQTLNVCK